MGWIVLLIKNALAWLDMLAEKPVLKAVPGLEDLLLAPEEMLAGREITIGPARRYASALFLGLLFGIVAWFVLIVLLVLVVHAAQGPPGWIKQIDFLLLPILVVMLVLSIFFTLRWLRGGQMILASGGVNLHYRGTIVFCPWALFHTPGQPFSPVPGRVVLPVVSAAVPGVEARRHGNLLADGLRVSTRQLKFRSANEAVLRAFYEVNAVELVKVLLHLGRILGNLPREAATALNFPMTELAEAEPARVDPSGWITVSLTRLAFPPHCCACGAATTGRQKFRVSEPFVSFARLWRPGRTEAVYVWVPVCYGCQTANSRRLRGEVLRGLASGLLLTLLLFLSVCLLPGQQVLVMLFVLSVLLAPLLGPLVGYRLGQRRALPVQFRDYSPERGTIAIRFHRPEYAEQMLRSMKGEKAG